MPPPSSSSVPQLIDGACASTRDRCASVHPPVPPPIRPCRNTAAKTTPRPRRRHLLPRPPAHPTTASIQRTEQCFGHGRMGGRRGRRPVMEERESVSIAFNPCRTTIPFRCRRDGVVVVVVVVVSLSPSLRPRKLPPLQSRCIIAHTRISRARSHPTRLGHGVRSPCSAGCIFIYFFFHRFVYATVVRFTRDNSV